MFSAIFFVAFLLFELPLLRNDQKRDRSNRAKQPREKKISEETKTTFFVMSPEPRLFFSIVPSFNLAHAVAYCVLRCRAPAHRTAHAEERCGLRWLVALLLSM
jgi:hypothetical protein